MFYDEMSHRSAVLATASEHSLNVKPQRIDLGVVRSDQVQSVIFAIFNNCRHTAESIVVHESCGCSVAKSKPDEIKEGKAAVLEAEFDPRGRVGPSEVFLIFEYRLAGRREQVLLTITTDVTE